MYYNVKQNGLLSVRISELDWDQRNEAHIARHSVRPEEVEEVCFGRHWAIRAKGRRRRAVFGQAVGGRYLMVILELVRPGIFRPITAREMDARERRMFRYAGGGS